MNGPADVAIAIAWVAAGLFGLLTFAFFAHRITVSLLTSRLQKRVTKAEKALQAARSDRFRSIDRLLFQLGSLNDEEAVEAALTDALTTEGDKFREAYVKVFRSLGMVDKLVEQVRSGSRWTERVTAARLLGQLQVVECVPALIAALRDPNEDAQTVKNAAGQALAAIRAPEAVPVLLDELQTVDDWASPRIAETLVAFGTIAIEPLTKALDNDDSVNVRVWAAQILGRIKDPSAGGPLLARLNDRSDEVRMSVAEALGRLKYTRAIVALTERALRDPVGPVRAEAARAIGIIGDETTVESLVKLLDDPDYWTRLRAIEAIETIDPKDKSALDIALRDPSPKVRARAAVALERVGILAERVNDLSSRDRPTVDRAQRTLIEMGRAGLIESMIGHLDHDDLRVRSRMVMVLGEVDDPHALEQIERCLTDVAWPVRIRAVESLAKVAPPNVVDLLLPSLSDEEESVRAATVQALSSMGLGDAPERCAQVMALYDSNNAEVRASVVQTIANVRMEAVSDLLRLALEDPNDEVRLRAVRAVKDRAAPEWVEPLVGRLSDSQLKIRAIAAEALQEVGTRSALDGVVRSLNTSDTELREALTNVLAKLSVREILDLVGEPESVNTRLGLIWALGKTGDQDALDLLRESSRSDEQIVRSATAGALGRLPCEESASILIAMIEDRSEFVRAAVCNALGMLRYERTVPALESRLQDPDAFVRNRAAIGLGRVGTFDAFERLDRVIDFPGNSDDFHAFLIIAWTIAAPKERVEHSLVALKEDAVQRRILRILAREQDDVQERFHNHLKLHSAEFEVSSSRWSVAELARQYVHSIRAAQEEAVRATAVRALATLDIEQFQVHLIDAARTDPSEAVRDLAFEKLILRAHDEAVRKAFIAGLRDPIPAVQASAAHGLGMSRDPAFNGELLACFISNDEQVREAAARSLATANHGRLLDFIDELLGHSETAHMVGGARVLGELGDPRAVPLLSEWRTSQAPKLRAAAVEALGHIGTDPARGLVHDSLQDPSDEVRGAVLRASVRSLRPDGAILDRFARDPSPALRAILADCLRENASATMLDVAKHLSQDPVESIRVRLLQALASHSSATATQAFLDLLENQPDSVRASLRKTGPSLHLSDIFGSDPNVERRLETLEMMAAIGAVRTEDLEVGCADPSALVRAAVVSVAYEFEMADQVAESLDRLLRDPSQRVREAVRRGRMALIE